MGDIEIINTIMDNLDILHYKILVQLGRLQDILENINKELNVDNIDSVTAVSAIVTSSDSTDEEKYVTQDESVSDRDPSLRESNNVDLNGQFDTLIFDGSTSWTFFYQQFENTAKKHGWTTTQKALLLLKALKGAALRTVQKFFPNNRPEYEAMVQLLDIRFEDGDMYNNRARELLRKHSQQHQSETLLQFGCSLETLVTNAYPSATEDLKERLCIQAFIDGLQDSEIRNALTRVEENFLSLNAAIKYARELELAKLVSLRKPGEQSD